jgi:eukaryotic-like serine/threonine-protein kinase
MVWTRSSARCSGGVPDSDTIPGMALRARVWSLGKVLMIAAGLAGTFVLSFAISMRLALKVGEVRVPDLTSRTANDATAIVTALGLSLRVEEGRRPDPSIGAGRVLGQEPPPGSIARRQRSVKVWLSAGQRAATVPTLTGETERTAQPRLAQDGLALASISEIHSPDYPPDVVVAQQPPARSAATSVALLVNRGERGPAYVMPDLIGFNGDRAAEILRAHGFRVAVVASAPYPGVPAGIVLRQSPQAGFQVAAEQAISLEVSR